MFGFVTAVLVTLGAALLGTVILLSTRHAERTRSLDDHLEGASFWDKATGKPMREFQRELDANHRARMFAISCFAFAGASAIGAVATWATMPGH